MKQRSRLRNALAVLILALATALTLFIVSNLRDNAPEEILESLPKNVDISLKEINYTETRDGQRSWTLTAHSAAHNLAEGVARIDNIRMTFFDEKMGELHVAADHGSLATEQRAVTAEGHVTIRSPEGYTFYTERLDYRESERVIRTDAPVRLESSLLNMTGRGLRLNVDDRSLVVLSMVRTDFPHGLSGAKK